MRRLKIAFFGSSLVSAYWNGAATYYRGLLRNLATLGHQIDFYEPDAYERQRHRDMPDPDWARVHVYPGDSEAAALGMLDRARTADVLVKASGVGVFDTLLEAAVAEASGPQRTTIFWDVDAPATLERVHADPNDPFRRDIPRYDLILTYGGGQPVVSSYQALGARRCVPVYNALDPETHFPVESEPRFESDLTFLGNRLPDREARVQAFFFSAARRAPEHRFLIGGNGWEPSALPPNVRSLGHVYTAQHNALNTSAKLVLNVTRESMVRFGWCPATRVFEAAGVGACLITDAWEGIEDFLTPGREVLVARDGEEVAELVASTSPERARAVGAAARRRILAGHTYAHRARQVEAVLGVGGARSAFGVGGASTGVFGEGSFS